MSGYDFYRTGKQDCGNTFDRQTFDVDIPALARKTIAEMQKLPRVRRDYRSVASQIALDALRKSDEWVSPKDWVRGTDFDPEEDGPLDEAYALWKAGYIDCAVPELTEWILEKIEEEIDR